MQKDLIKLKAELADSQQKNMDLEKKLSDSTSGLEDLKKKMVNFFTSCFSYKQRTD